MFLQNILDGTQILDSKKKKCESRLTMNKRGVAHYTHNAAVMSTIGNTANIALDFEMYRAKKNEEEKDEGEFTAALRLLNRVVNNLKNNANLNHCFVHGGNAVEAILYLMFIVSNLFQLFKTRRLKNHVSNQIELVRLLVKGFYTIKPSKEIIFNST